MCEAIPPCDGGEPWHGVSREPAAAPGSLEVRKDGVAGLGTVWSSGRCPCPRQGVGTG